MSARIHITAFILVLTSCCTSRAELLWIREADQTVHRRPGVLGVPSLETGVVVPLAAALAPFVPHASLMVARGASPNKHNQPDTNEFVFRCDNHPNRPPKGSKQSH
jgi:hypothetical protein